MSVYKVYIFDWDDFHLDAD